MNGVSFTYLFIVFGLPAASAPTGRYWAHLGTVFENRIISCCSKRRLSSQSGKWISSKDIYKHYPINLLFTKDQLIWKQNCRAVTSPKKRYYPECDNFVSRSTDLKALAFKVAGSITFCPKTLNSQVQKWVGLCLWWDERKLQYFEIWLGMWLSMYSRSVGMVFHHYVLPHVPQRMFLNDF